MKFNLKALVVASAAALVAGHASAGMVTGYAENYVENGSLFLAVWDSSNNKSYVRDLGTYLDSFLPQGDRVRAAGFSTTLAAASSAFTTQFAGSTTNLRWAVIGVDNVSGDGTTSRYLTTVSANPSSTTNAGVRQIANNAVSYMGTLVDNGLVNDTSGAEYISTGTDGSDAAGTLIAAPLTSLFPSGISTNYGSAYFWLGTAVSTGSNAVAASWEQYSNGNQATMTLASDGSLIYNVAAFSAPPAPSAVPVPAAAWLMGSGLVGLIGAARRRKAA